MSCLKYLCNPLEKDEVCNEISYFLNSLNIPTQEQRVLWNIAINKIGCLQFRDILITLAIRTSVLLQ